LVFPKGVWLAQIGIDRLYILIPYIYWLSIPEKALYLLIFLFPIDIDGCFPGQKEPSLTVALKMASPFKVPGTRSVRPGWIHSLVASAKPGDPWRIMEISGRKPSQTGKFIAICEEKYAKPWCWYIYLPATG